MKRSLLAAVLAATLLAAPAAQAAPDRAVTLSAVEPVASWSGAAKTAFNTTFYMASTTGRAACGKTAQDFCEDTLVRIDPELAGAKKLAVRLDGFSQASDFDLRVYASNATGDALNDLGSPQGEVTQTSPLGTLDPRATAHGDFETKDLTGVKAGQHYLVRIVYFAVADEGYRGTVTLK